MKKTMISTWPCAFVFALGLVSYSTSSIAEGTPEQRAACTPDVFRLCSSEIPNVTKIIACLKKEKTNLSVGCQAVFNTTTTTTASATRSIGSLSNEWCDFRGSARDSKQQDWLHWCGSAARK